MRLLGKREVAFLSSIYDSQRKFRGKREKPFFNPSKLIGFIYRLVSKIFSGNRVWHSIINQYFILVVTFTVSSSIKFPLLQVSPLS